MLKPNWRLIGHIKHELREEVRSGRTRFSLARLKSTYRATEDEVRKAVADYNSEFSPVISLTNPGRTRGPRHRAE